MKYTVYKTTNKINGKIYIGVHKTKDLNDGYLGSGKYLGRAIEKYGKENFEKEILAVFDKASDMFEMESELVNEDFVERDDTYNLKTGGEGGFDYINENKKAVNIKEQQLRNPEIISLANKRGIETQKHLYENDSEWVQKRSKNLSLGIQKYYADGGENGFKNKKHSEEFKLKMSKIMKEHQSGFGNSQFGKMWIHNLDLKESKRIMKTDLIPEGWIKGRKMKF